MPKIRIKEKPKIRLRFTPTFRKSNAGIIGHPSVKSNAGIIRVRRKKK